MTAIAEDYVSFETAKLLKEKGFDEPVTELNKMLFKDGEKPVLKITLQKAMKWLREVYKIDISVYPYGNYSSDNYQFDVYEYRHLIVSKDEGYMTYEQACEGAIKFCLKNLI